MVVGISIFSWHGFTILYNDAMFVRVKRSVSNGSTYEYLQIVESFAYRWCLHQRGMNGG